MTVHDHDPLSGLEEQFKTVQDPRIVKLIGDVKCGNKMILTGELGQGDIRDTRESFDQDWVLLKSPMQITGNIFYTDKKDGIQTDDVGLMEDVVALDSTVFSIGFDTRKFNNEEQFGYLFLFDFDDDGGIVFPSAGDPRYIGWAPIEGTIVDGVDLPNEQTEEYMNHYLPHVKQMLDDIKAKHSDPLAFVEAIMDFEISIGELTGSTQRKDIQAIEHYMTELSDLEALVPYSGALRGIIYLKSSEDEVIQYKISEDWLHMLVVPRQIELIPIMNKTERGYIPDNSRFMPAINGLAALLDKPEYKDGLVEVKLPISEDLVMASNNDFMRRVDTSSSK